MHEISNVDGQTIKGVANQHKHLSCVKAPSMTTQSRHMPSTYQAEPSCSIATPQTSIPFEPMDYVRKKYRRGDLFGLYDQDSYGVGTILFQTLEPDVNVTEFCECFKVSLYARMVGSSLERALHEPKCEVCVFGPFLKISFEPPEAGSYEFRFVWLGMEQPIKTRVED